MRTTTSTSRSESTGGLKGGLRTQGRRMSLPLRAKGTTRGSKTTLGPTRMSRLTFVCSVMTFTASSALPRKGVDFCKSVRSVGSSTYRARLESLCPLRHLLLQRHLPLKPLDCSKTLHERPRTPAVVSHPRAGRKQLAGHLDWDLAHPPQRQPLLLAKVAQPTPPTVICRQQRRLIAAASPELRIPDAPLCRLPGRQQPAVEVERALDRSSQGHPQLALEGAFYLRPLPLHRRPRRSVRSRVSSAPSHPS